MGELLRGGIFTIIFFGVNMPPPFYRKYAPTSLKQLSTASNNAYHILLRSEPVHCSILIEMSLPKFTMPDRSGILDDWNQSRNSRSTAYPETSLFPYSLIYPGSLSAAQKIWTSLFLPTTAAVYNCIADIKIQIHKYTNTKNTNINTNIKYQSKLSIDGVSLNFLVPSYIPGWPVRRSENLDLFFANNSRRFPEVAQKNVWFFLLPSTTVCWCVLPCKEKSKKSKDKNLNWNWNYPKQRVGKKRHISKNLRLKHNKGNFFSSLLASKWA